MTGWVRWFRSNAWRRSPHDFVSLLDDERIHILKKMLSMKNVLDNRVAMLNPLRADGFHPVSC